MSNFVLHEQLKNDCVLIGEFELNLVLLANDQQYLWFILVPKREAVSEIHQLNEEDQQQLIKESSRFSKAIQTIFSADKMNVAALGNLVPQLHIHHVARYKNDAAWPKPIWGLYPAEPYAADKIKEIKTKIHDSSIAGLDVDI